MIETGAIEGISSIVEKLKSEGIQFGGERIFPSRCEDICECINYRNPLGIVSFLWHKYLPTTDNFDAYYTRSGATFSVFPS